MEENRQDYVMLWCQMSLRRCEAFHNTGNKQDSVINRENFTCHHMHPTSAQKHTSARSTPPAVTPRSDFQLLQPTGAAATAAERSSRSDAPTGTADVTEGWPPQSMASRLPPLSSPTTKSFPAP